MRRNHKGVLGLILAVMIGSCLLPSSALSTSTDLNTFHPGGNPFEEISGFFGTVGLEVTPGEAHFSLPPVRKDYQFAFSTSLTLNPEDFIFDKPGHLTVGGGFPVPFSAVTVTGCGSEDPYCENGLSPGFSIINPEIVSENQFGFYYALWGYFHVPIDGYPLEMWGYATNEVPEPSTMLLLGSGLLGLWGARRKLRK